MAGNTYLPALRFRSLTAIYDPLVRWTTRESLFKPRLLEHAAIADGDRVLDVGCGTGTLAIMIKQRFASADVVGLDADPEMLAQAEQKADRSGVELQLDQGFADQLPYEDGEFDRVVSSLFFHHLKPGPKRTAASEIARVLRPGGELHVADWGRPADPLMWVLFQQVRLFDGRDETRAAAAGLLPHFFEQAGLEDASEHDRLRTAFGTLSLYSARVPARR